MAFTPSQFEKVEGPDYFALSTTYSLGSQDYYKLRVVRKDNVIQYVIPSMKPVSTTYTWLNILANANNPLPEKYRPAIDVLGQAYDGNNNKYVLFKITTSGEFQIYLPVATTSNMNVGVVSLLGIANS